MGTTADFVRRHRDQLDRVPALSAGGWTIHGGITADSRARMIEMMGDGTLYDGVYAAYVAADPVQLNLASLAPRWQGPEAPPERRAAWRGLGDLSGKTVLLLGERGLVSQVYLLTARPVVLVYSDVSPIGLRNIGDGYTLDGHADRLLFAAIEACDLPMLDGPVDVIWGLSLRAPHGGPRRVSRPDRPRSPPRRSGRVRGQMRTRRCGSG